MIASLRVVFAVASVAALVGQTAAYINKCSHTSWGRKSDNVHTDAKTIEAGYTNAMLEANSQVEGCVTVGAIAIACDPLEEPVVNHWNGDLVLVHRRFARGPAKFVFVTFCEPVFDNSPFNGIPYNVQNLPHVKAIPLPSSQG